MTYRAQGWLYAIAVSFSFWSLVAIVSHEAMMLWDQPADNLLQEEDV